MTDISGHDEIVSASLIESDSASAIADADGHARQRVILLKDFAKSISCRLARIQRNSGKSGCGGLSVKAHKAALTCLTDAARDIAKIKNVAVTPDECSMVAGMAMTTLGAPRIRAMLKLEHEAVALSAMAINRLLDILAGAFVICLMRHLEGFDHLDQDQVTAEAEAWVRQLVTSDIADRRYRWPDPLEMVTTFFRTRCSGPVKITFPLGRPVRAAYMLDRAASNNAMTGPKPSTVMPVPLIIRGPGDSKFSSRTTGRLTTKHPDGTTCETWWRNGKLHRDESEGPARTVRFPETGITSIEEFYQHGKLHRLHGPSLTSWYEDGTLCARTWHHGGQLHRDPAEGSAMTQWNLDGSLAAEEIWVGGKFIEDLMASDTEIVDA